MSTEIQKINITLPGQDSYMVQEAIKVIRTNLEFCGRDIKTIAFTSYGENEGKTTVSLLMARSMAELGKKVLFIDADMRKSVLTGRNTDSKDYTGLSEVLSGIKDIKDSIHETTSPGLYILQAGKYPPNPVELINSKYFEDLVNTARDTFDYVIIDTPPLGYTIDSAIIATLTDGMVLVIGNPDLRRRQLKKVMTQLRRSNCRILGAIINSAMKQSRGANRLLKTQYAKRYYSYRG